MLTDDDFKKLKKQIEEIFNAGYKALRKDLKNISNNSKENLAELKSIRQEQKELGKKLDKFFTILERLEKRQIIMEKKMREIEDYFDPPGRN